MIEDHIVARAKAVRIEDELARRGHRHNLKKVSKRDDSWQLAGSCPVCSGDDRFGVHPQRQIWNCRQCGRGGDIINLVRWLDRCDFETAVYTLTNEKRPAAANAAIAAHRTPPVGATKVRASQAKDHSEDTSYALGWWRDAVSIESTLAEIYLCRRGLDIPARTSGSVLRFHPRCIFGAERLPCMVALFRNIHTNAPQAIHRTALTPAGDKIDRKSLGPVSGAAIKVSADDEVTMGLMIGEGFEKVVKAMVQRDLRPAWCVGSATAIRDFPVLAGIECLTILVDHDSVKENGKRTGQDAAAACTERWVAAGCSVRQIMSPIEGEDVEDALNRIENGNTVGRIC